VSRCLHTCMEVFTVCRRAYVHGRFHGLCGDRGRTPAWAPMSGNEVRSPLEGRCHGLQTWREGFLCHGLRTV